MDYKTQNKISSEVYHSIEDSFSLSKDDMDRLIDLAKATSRGRVRYCSHSSRQDSLHEMFIVHPKGAYVKPHKHLDKIESMLVIDGEVDYIIFDDVGKIDSVIAMGDFNSNKPFYQTIRKDIFHTLLIKSEWLVFLEITNGPFKENDTIFAEWSPDESNVSDVRSFIRGLSKK